MVVRRIQNVLLTLGCLSSSACVEWEPVVRATVRADTGSAERESACVTLSRPVTALEAAEGTLALSPQQAIELATTEGEGTWRWTGAPEQTLVVTTEPTGPVRYVWERGEGRCEREHYEVELLLTLETAGFTLEQTLLAEVEQQATWRVELPLSAVPTDTLRLDLDDWRSVHLEVEAFSHGTGWLGDATWVATGRGGGLREEAAEFSTR